MTTEQKTQIFTLRAQGYGYTSIAKAVELKKDTVKSFCRRNGVAGIRAVKQVDQQNRCPPMWKSVDSSGKEETPAILLRPVQAGVVECSPRNGQAKGGLQLCLFYLWEAIHRLW